MLHPGWVLAGADGSCAAVLHSSTYQSTAGLQTWLEQPDLSSSYSVCVTVFYHLLLVTCAREHLQRDATYCCMQHPAQRLISLLQFEISESELSLLIQWCSKCLVRLIFVFTVYYRKTIHGKYCHSPLYQQLEFKCMSQIDSSHSPKFLKLAHGGQCVACLRVLNSLDSFFLPGQADLLTYFFGEKSMIGSFFQCNWDAVRIRLGFLFCWLHLR